MPDNTRSPAASQVLRFITPLLLACTAMALSAPLAAEPRDSATLATQFQLPDAATLEREGAVIGEVFINADNVFDLTDPKEDKALYGLANTLHISTQPRVVRQQLLFKSGDPYSKRKLEESERILRAARYIYDASVRPVAYKDGRVDVSVTTRDVWTLNPGVSFGRKGGENTSGVELEELNLLGTGTALSFARKSGVDRDSTLIEYRNPHVASTWTTLAASYASNSDGSVKGLSVARPFYELDARWAAAVDLLDDDRVESLYDHGAIVEDFRSHQKFASLSWGWSKGLENGWARRWLLGATYDETRFERTSALRPLSLLPDDRTFVYPWIGVELVQDDFHKFRNHDQIGRTEDFLLGTRANAKLGWAATALGSDRDAMILSAAARRGVSAGNDKTWLVTSGFKGRVESGELRNAVIDSAVRYYARQSERRLFFASLSGSAGRALDLDTQILLGGDNGLRGYPLRYQSGDARALLTVEQRYFTNWYPWRLFRVGGAAFVDVGRTWGDSVVGAPSDGLLKDVGIGLRIGNTRSGLGNVIHVDLAFPLDGGASIKDVQFLIETRERF